MIAAYTTNWENYKYFDNHENSLFIKKFIFKLTNC